MKSAEISLADLSNAGSFPPNEGGPWIDILSAVAELF